ncbi:PDR/VanB family oxidoreductase [Rhodococcus sp. 14-2483-1-2]|uniref:PDR/VanB family oxidoreductase n=1 Tax=Rhodococcus sp. 14-2483-1-2 TaxID=2023147 RepID=UPI00207B3698|nr:PDR/VanB family oxidoreductase [Rhodococcus sp. 14-2483-1-2]
MVSATVAEFVVESASGESLPSWDPGAHIDVHIPDGSERQYSLCGNPTEPRTYRFAVLREPDGRGGSEWLHDRVHRGDELVVNGPRNNFGLAESAPAYHLVAGGVGITPILAMASHLQSAGAGWRLTYLGRSRKTMAYLDELATLDETGDRVEILASDETERRDLAELLGHDAPGTYVYACGPESLLEGLESAVADGARVSLHVERFAPRDRNALDEAGAPFEVELTVSGLRLTVPSGESILDVAEKAGVPAPYSCREGTCGTCETRIVDGIADHRDSILTTEERDANDYLMICVSRSNTPRLVIEL